MVKNEYIIGRHNYCAAKQFQVVGPLGAHGVVVLITPHAMAVLLALWSEQELVHLGLELQIDILVQEMTQNQWSA